LKGDVMQKIIIPPAGRYNLQVVGESHYIANIKKHMGPDHEVVTGETFVTIWIFREPSNIYDRNAVRVEIEGDQVGYLSKADAEQFAQFMSANTFYELQGRIGGYGGIYGVTIDFSAEKAVEQIKAASAKDTFTSVPADKDPGYSKSTKIMVVVLAILSLLMTVAFIWTMMSR